MRRTDSLWEKAFSAEPDRRMIRSNINNQTLNPHLEYISMVEMNIYTVYGVFNIGRKNLSIKSFKGGGDSGNGFILVFDHIS